MLFLELLLVYAFQSTYSKKKLEEKGQKHKKRGGEREFGGVMTAYSNQVKLFQLCKEIRMINTLDEGSEKIFLQDVI